MSMRSKDAASSNWQASALSHVIAASSPASSIACCSVISVSGSVSRMSTRRDRSSIAYSLADVLENSLVVSSSECLRKEVVTVLRGADTKSVIRVTDQLGLENDSAPRYATQANKLNHP